MADFEFLKPADPVPTEDGRPLITEVASYSTVAPLYYKNVPCTVRPPWQEHALPVQPENGAVPPDKGNGYESSTCPPDSTINPNMPNTPETK